MKKKRKTVDNPKNDKLTCKQRGHKKVKRDRLAVHRTNNKLLKKCKKLQTRCEIFRKRSFRLKKKKLIDSLMSKVKNMIAEAHGKITLNIKKKLLLGEVFLTQLRKRIPRNQLNKNTISKLLYSKYIKKYKLFCSERHC